MRLFILIQAAVCIIGALVLAADAKQNGVSFGIGGALITLNIMISAKLWNWVLEKKLVALAVSLIVFKYPILVIIIIRLLREPWIEPLWFCLGLGSFTASSLIFAAVGIKKDVV